MPKIKLKIIMATVFCFVFISTMQVIATKNNNEENKNPENNQINQQDEENESEYCSMLDKAVISDEKRSDEKLNDLSEIDLNGHYQFTILPGYEFFTKLYFKFTETYNTDDKENLLCLYNEQIKVYYDHFENININLPKKIENIDFFYNNYININEKCIYSISVKNAKLSSKYKCIHGSYYYKLEYLFEDFLNIKKIIKDAENIFESLDKSKCKQETIYQQDETNDNIKKIKENIENIKNMISKCRLIYNIDEHGEILNLARYAIEAYKKNLKEKLKNIENNQIDDILLNDIKNMLIFKAKTKAYIDILKEIKQKEAKEKDYDFIYTQFNDLFEVINKEIEDESFLENDILKQQIEDIKNKINIEKDIKSQKDIFFDNFKKEITNIKKMIFGKEKDIEKRINNNILKKDIEKDGFDAKFKKLNNLTDELEKDIKEFNENNLNKNMDIMNLKDIDEIDLKDLSELNLAEVKNKKVRVITSPLNQQPEHKYYGIDNKSELLDLYIEQLECYKLHFQTLFENNQLRNSMNYSPLQLLNTTYYIKYRINSAFENIIRSFDEDKEIHLNDTYDVDLKEDKDISENDLIDLLKGGFLEEILKKNNAIGSKYLKLKGYYEAEEIIKDCVNAEKIINDVDNQILPSMNGLTDNENLNKKIKKLTYLKENISKMLDKILNNNIVKWEIDYFYQDTKSKYTNILDNLYKNIIIYLFFLINLYEEQNTYRKYHTYNTDCDENCIIAILTEYENFNSYKGKSYIIKYLKNARKSISINKSLFNLFKNSYFYSKYYEGNIHTNGYLYTLKDLINDVADITIIKDKINDYIEKFKKYKEDEAKKKKSNIIYNRYNIYFEQINIRMDSGYENLKNSIKKFIDTFEIEQKVKDAIEKKLKEQEEDIINQNIILDNSKKYLEKDKNKIVMGYGLDDLSELNLNKTNLGKVRVIDSEKDEKKFKYYDISDKYDLLFLYLEQLLCYYSHFNIMFNKNDNIPSVYDDDYYKDLYIKYPIANFDANKISILNSYIGSKYEDKKGYYKREHIVKEANNLYKIIKNFNIIKNSIKDSEFEINTIKLNENDGDDNNIDTILTNLKTYLKNIEKGYAFIFDENNKKINDDINEIKTYYWHFKNIYWYLYTICEHGMDLNHELENTFKIKPYLDDLEDKYTPENIDIKKFYNINNEDEFNLFKSSNVYKKYYTQEKIYSLGDLLFNIEYIENFKEKLKENLKDLKEKIKKEDEFTYNQFQYLTEQTKFNINALETIIKQLKKCIEKTKNKKFQDCIIDNVKVEYDPINKKTDKTPYDVIETYNEKLNIKNHIPKQICIASYHFENDCDEKDSEYKNFFGDVYKEKIYKIIRYYYYDENEKKYMQSTDKNEKIKITKEEFNQHVRKKIELKIINLDKK